MGCWTIYIVREVDGSLRWSGDKWGVLEHASADALLAHVAAMTLHDAAPGFLQSSWCRGWYVDAERRFARMYTCGTNASVASPAWPAWDARVAVEGIHDIAALVGEHCADDHAHLLDEWRGCAEARLVTTLPADTYPGFVHRWDPMRQELHHGWYFHEGCDISVIDHDGLATHYGFADRHALFPALGHGQVLLEELATFSPCPEVVAEDAGAVIDIPHETIFVWHRDPIARATYDELRARWPGWTIVRDVAGVKSHLARTAQPRVRAVLTD